MTVSRTGREREAFDRLDDASLCVCDMRNPVNRSVTVTGR
jgi:hypothetical protein